MRDIFDEIFANNPLDPVESARRDLRPALRKRFYETASIQPRSDGRDFAITLDGRVMRTPARRELTAPDEELARAIAAEWQAQRDVIDPLNMPLTRLANSIIDGVADQRAAVVAEIEKFLGSDLVCYRADHPERLTARQRAHWDPLVAFAREQLGARFRVTTGITYVVQPAAAIVAAMEAVPREPWPLGAMHAVTTLTGSAVIAIALARGAINPNAAWAAAHVDEDWNMELWGNDELALERRAYRRAEMDAAALVLTRTVPR